MPNHMTPSRPYLLRAFYDWLLDNDMTPHLLVNTKVRHVKVPMQFVKDDQIVLNIAPQAVMAFTIDNEALSFSARFGGVPFQVYVPMAAVMAIHARENGMGTFFPPEEVYAAWEDAEADEAVKMESADDVPPSPDDTPKPTGSTRPTLRIVK